MTEAPRRTRPAAPAPAPLSEAELDELQALLDRVPPPLEPLDVSMLDGYLCGVLLQPQRIAAARWLPHVTDADGRALPGPFDAQRLHALVLRRHAELDAAIGARQWFDPWVFELDDADGPAGAGAAGGEARGAADDDTDAEFEDDGDAIDPAASEAVYPWVAGFATALELFPGLMQTGTAATITEPLALLYRHLDPDDLEDADDLIEAIDSIEPPADLAESVEGLVRATLLLADVTRPLPGDRSSRPGPPARRGGPRPTSQRRR
jgi:uncharacterized protein